MDIVNHKPIEGGSLYDFQNLSKIIKLKVNFSDSDKVSLIYGAINDNNITLAVEASNIVDLNVLGAYLKNSESKFYKEVMLEGQRCKAFIDFGSECSIVKKTIAEQFKFSIKNLETSVTLSGFLGTSTIVTQYILINTEIDEVNLNIRFYVTDNAEFKFNILIGSDFTENPNIGYYKVDKLFFFKKRVHIPESLKNINCGEILSSDLERKAHNVSLAIEGSESITRLALGQFSLVGKGGDDAAKGQNLGNLELKKSIINVKKIIHEHCDSLSHNESHYSREDSKLNYFKDQSLTLNKLHTLFIDYYKEKTKNNKIPIKNSTYFNYFNHFVNFSFEWSRIDVCCYQYEKLGTENNEAAQKHKKIVKKCAIMKEAMLSKAGKYLCLEFDFAQNLSMPKIPVNAQFYLRLLWLHVFNVQGIPTRTEQGLFPGLGDLFSKNEDSHPK
ncbi:hypothetical protein ABEB36_009433 [Hypothenemus hampei]|uniref:Peptidase A2B Ty3 transposon peptidase domain-containing protein n=1 Tax=Hypothenemus hampei TaxID=57062 RepID=A0ABD1EGA9_HYPHA